MTQPLLEIIDVSAAYGNIQALSSVSLTVPDQQIVALLGANGAGKTTTLNVVSRIVAHTGGDIRFAGESIRRLSSDAVVARGLVQVPEGREVFGAMSVRENLELGAYLQRNPAIVRRELERVLEMFPRLKERLAQKALTLSGGEQQMLAIGRALMTRPRMILFDEPSMGLSPVLVDTIFHAIKQLNREEQLTILLVEQNAQLALDMSSYAYILENGELALSGASAELKDDERVRQAYLGG